MLRSPRTAEELVVEVPQIGQPIQQLALEDARVQDPSASQGDNVKIMSGPRTRVGGSSKCLSGTDELDRDVLNCLVFGARGLPKRRID